MLSLAQSIRHRRRELGLTLQQLADRADCTKGYLSSIENDRRPGTPSHALLQRLESALQLPPDTLTLAGGWQATPALVRQRVRTLEEQSRAARQLADLLKRQGVDTIFKSGELERLVSRLTPEPAPSSNEHSSGGMAWMGTLPMQVPVINRVAAGYPTEFTDLGYPARVADEYVSVPDVADADAFAARVCGDSMSPTYLQGDIVVFSPAASTPEGADCFVRFERNAETTFKRVYFERSPGGDELIRLQPLNSAYPPRTVPREDVAALYAAVYVVRAVRGET